MKKTIIQTSPYEKKQIVKNSQHISVSDYREVSLDDILKKITNEIEKRKKNLNEKGSKMTSLTFSYFSFSANFQVKRLETDAEYRIRIAKHEKNEEAKRKREEDKIKKEFKKLTELKEKYGKFSSPEEALMDLKMKKANNIINVVE